MRFPRLWRNTDRMSRPAEFVPVQTEAGLCDKEFRQALAARTGEVTGLDEVVAPRVREIRASEREALWVERRARIVETDRAPRELSGQVARLREQLASLARENSALQHLLERERLTVIRPVLRRSLLAAKRFSRALPHPPRVFVRTAFYELVLRLAPRSNLAQQYDDFKRATNYVRPPMKAADLQSEAPPLEDTLIQAARDYGGSGIDVFIFPIIDWHFRIQRPQHISSRLARHGHRIFYCLTTFLPTSGPAFRLLDMPGEGVFLYQLSCPDPHPVIYSTLLSGKQQVWLAQAIRSLHEMVGARPAVAVLHLPFWRSVAIKISSAALIYDCMDYHAGFSNTSDGIRGEEQKLVNQADIVVTSSLALSNHVQGAVANVLIRNGAEVEFFSAPPEAIVARSPRPTVGYFGTIAEWFDTELVAAAANAFLDWDFVLIGSAAHADVSKLRRFPNVKLPGERPYAELPGWLHSFDICIIPFKLNDLILHTNPVKLYEYLSAGKPVVATPLPELVLLEDGLVHIAGTKETFLEKLSSAMSECGDLEKVNARRRWAAEQTWDDRADKFCRVIRSCLPKVSVVVLCHNNLEFTESCLSSLDQFTLYPNWELIVVDNASQDGTATYLEGYVTTRPWARAIVSNENRGFSGGNNLGLKEASGDYLVLLNNDTFVTRGWLAGLIRHLRRDPSLGLVGPVTNNIGNEARIDIVYQSMDEMGDKARSYMELRHGKLLHVDNLGFFCVAFSREVYKQVGPLDEAFRIGFFEDDDYCKRTQLAGYGIGIAEDVFVHHHLSASFDSLGRERRQAIFDESRRVYEAKWGPWRPRPGHYHNRSGQAAGG
jgi:GT2 family glycosyltransferase/glycosyltransferase involved in cell wall biosynthesis